jgi:hypothetical protein
VRGRQRFATGFKKWGALPKMPGRRRYIGAREEQEATLHITRTTISKKTGTPVIWGPRLSPGGKCLVARRFPAAQRNNKTVNPPEEVTLAEAVDLLLKGKHVIRMYCPVTYQDALLTPDKLDIAP